VKSVPAARQFVRETLRERSPATVDAAELMASELATNSVRHGKSEFELTIQARPQVRVEIRDANRSEPVMADPAPLDPTGRGLRIVQAMSDGWGIIPSTDGKTVWFVLGEEYPGPH
jgi:anti-sigma regulatory factor (Ser/Thr protein kinase)